MNKCAKCKDRSAKTGRSYCDLCAREYGRKYNNQLHIRNKTYNKLYGIDVAEYEAMLEKQNNACALCLTPQIQLLVKLSVDHRHSDGKVRGLLCHPCNTFLGLIQDDVVRLKRMIGYLSDT